MSVLDYKLDLLMNARDNMRQALLGKGQVVNNDLRTYAQAIRNISGGGVKLFESKQEMKESTGNVEGMYGILYSQSTVFISPNSTFNTLYFPSKVSFDDAYVTQLSSIITFDVPTSLFLLQCEVNPNGTVTITVTLNKDDSIKFIIVYESTDGKVFNRTSSTFEDSWEIEETIWEYESETGIVDLNDVCVADDYVLPDSGVAVLEKFVTSYNRDLGGLYQYKEDISKEYLYGITNINMIEPPIGQLVTEFTFDKEEIYLPKFVDAIEDLLIETGMNGIQANMLYNPETRRIYLDNMDEESEILETYVRGEWNKFLSTEDTQSGDVDCPYYEIDPFEGEFVARNLSSTSLYTSYDTRSGTGVVTTHYIHKLNDLEGNFYHLGTIVYYKDEDIKITVNDIWGNYIRVAVRPDDTTTQPNFPYTEPVGDDNDCSFVTKLDWYNVKTSFTLERPSQLMPHIKGLGVNGIIEGDGNIYKTINSLDYMSSNGIKPFKDYTVAMTNTYGEYVDTVPILSDYLIDVKESSFGLDDNISYWEVQGNYCISVINSGYTVKVYDIKNKTYNIFDVLSNSKNGIGNPYIFVENNVCHILQILDSNECLLLDMSNENNYIVIPTTLKLDINSASYFMGRWILVVTDESTTEPPYKLNFMSIKADSSPTIMELKSLDAKYTNKKDASGYYYTYYANNGLTAYFTIPTSSNDNGYNVELYYVAPQVGSSSLTVAKVPMSYTSKIILTRNGYMLYNKNVYRLDDGIEPSLPSVISGCNFTEDIDNSGDVKYIGDYDIDTKTFMYYKDMDRICNITLTNLNDSSVNVGFDNINLLVKNSNDIYNNFNLRYITNTIAIVYADVNDSNGRLSLLEGVIYFDKGIKNSGTRIKSLYANRDKKLYMYIPKYGILNDPHIDYTGDILGE